MLDNHIQATWLKSINAMMTPDGAMMKNIQYLKRNKGIHGLYESKNDKLLK